MAAVPAPGRPVVLSTRKARRSTSEALSRRPGRGEDARGRLAPGDVFDERLGAIDIRLIEDVLKTSGKNADNAGRIAQVNMAVRRGEVLHKDGQGVIATDLLAVVERKGSHQLLDCSKKEVQVEFLLG